MSFDPDAAAVGGGLYGLPGSPAGARFVVLPVPFDATTSFRDGARHGPDVVLQASAQVDLFDVDFGRPWRHGIAMHEELARRIRVWNREARRLARPVIDAGGVVEGRPRLAGALARVNAIGGRVNSVVLEAARSLLAAGKTPIVLGGDHSTPFGALEAYGEVHPGLGILHVDAHADLRDAYEGFVWSHASIMHNVVHRIGPKGGIATLVQVGIRDLGERERDEIAASRRPGRTRIVTHFDADLKSALFHGKSWAALAKAIVRALPKKVYVSIDIDGLDPMLCPDTGTPVPGGLSFAGSCSS
ncbi:MAG: arginase family protein [Acidobacteriota bacterium]